MSEFKTIAGYDNFQVSRDGIVQKVDANGSIKIITPWKCGRHTMVTLCTGGQQRNFYLHRLVLIAYGPEQPTDKPLALHLDDNGDNNDISNLVWGDKRDNAQMAIANGLIVDKHLRHNFTSEQAQAIRSDYAAGKSMAVIAREYGCSRWTVSNIVHDRIKRLATGSTTVRFTL